MFIICEIYKIKFCFKCKVMSNRLDNFKSQSDPFTEREKEILNKIKKFFSSNKKYIETFLTIIDGKSEISIRVLDWFVTNYSKKHATKYNYKKNGYVESFFVFLEYKKQLSAFSKKNFDPFCRKNSKKLSARYYYKNDQSIKINSAICQLNFFYWAIRYKIIDYVTDYLEEIETDMKETNKKNKERKLKSMSETPTISDYSDSFDIFKSDPEICTSEDIQVHVIGKCVGVKPSVNKQRKSLSNSKYTRGVIKESNVYVDLD